MDTTKVTKDLENKALIIERVFDTPKEKLWKVYADKDWFEKWWRPEGWETTAKVFEFTPGGTIHYGMKCVDENQGEWFGQELVEEEGRTRLTSRSICNTVEDLEQLVKMGMVEGFSSQLNKLEGLLAS